jgi:hypothetical protein
MMRSVLAQPDWRRWLERRQAIALDGAGRRAAPIALALAVASALSLARAALLGTLAVDRLPPLERYLPLALFGLAAALAGAAHLAAIDRPPLTWRALAAGALAVQLAAFPSLPLTSNDLFSNLAYGRLAALGLDPYLFAPRALPVGDAFRALVGARWLDTPIVYGPIAEALDAACGRAATVAGALAALKALTFAASLAAVALAWGFTRARMAGERARAAFVFFAWSPLAAWELAGQAHNDALMVAATVAFVWALCAGRELTAALALAAALLAKPAVAPLAPIFLIMVARRSPARALALALAMAAAAALAFFPHWHGLDSLRGPLGTLGGDPSRTARSLADLAWWAAAPLGQAAQRAASRGAGLAGAIVVVCLLGRALARARDAPSVIAGGLEVMLGYCLTCAWFQPWYVTWLAPLALAHPDARMRRLVAAYGALALLSYALPIDPVSSVAIDLWVARRWLRIARDPAGATA